MSPQKHQNRKRQRKIEYLSAIDKKYYIFCEGQQTEPLYFDAFKKAIKANPMYKNAVHVEVTGVGAETLRVDVYKRQVFIRIHMISSVQVYSFLFYHLLFSISIFYIILKIKTA